MRTREQALFPDRSWQVIIWLAREDPVTLDGPQTVTQNGDSGIVALCLIAQPGS